MVFMTMCDHETFDFGNIFLQIGHIRNDKVDTKHIVFREGKPAVNDYNTVFVFKCCDVHSDLLKSAKRNDFQLGCAAAALT